MRTRRLLPAASWPGADLPVRPALKEVVAALGARGTAVLVAPPGSGKTSLLPLALADAVDGRVIVAEPRRLATRAAAQRLATLVGEEPGRSVGYAMRGERAGGRDTRVEVVTTGLLVQRLQRDPELPGVAAVVIDECHERHLDADLALAFCLDVRATLRADLLLVATSATPDTAAMAEALGSGDGPAPVVTADAARFDLQTFWTPPPTPLPLLPGARVDRRLLVHVADVARRALADGAGDVLVFLPGEAEVAAVAGALGDAAEVVALFGRQSRAQQQRVFDRSARRRVIVSTSVAESSLTVPGVRAVVDSGLARQPRLDPARGLTALVTTRVSRSSADQRAGRAGREGPGRVYRCWSRAEHVHLAAQTPPEIATTDLAGFALAVAAWGAPGGRGLALLDAPPAPALDAAEALLRGLDALDANGRITARGRRLAAVGSHPRLARALLDGGELVGSERAEEIVALLSDDTLAGRGDDLPARLRELRGGRDRAATERWREEVRRLRHPSTTARRDVDDDRAVGTVVGLAYPDRVARARSADASAYLTSAGTGAALADGSGLRGSPWLAVAVADRPAGRTDARIRSAAPIDESTARLVAGDLLRTDDEISWTDDGLVTRRVEALGAIRLSAAPLPDPDPARVLAAVRDGIVRSGLGVLTWTDAARSLRARLAFCHAHLREPWPDVDDPALLDALDSWLGPDLLRVRRTRDLSRIDVAAALRRLLPWPAATRFDELAPERLTVPSGSRIRIAYDGAAAPVVAVKLQETFGWRATPTLADGRVAVVLHLLSPAGRTVAVTADLASFWSSGYLQVRSELRARYPKHPWPENPLDATPTARTQRRR